MASFAFEKHYRVQELARIWGLSTKTVRRLFAKEPDVIRVANDLTGKRQYATLLIPESVASRVHERLRNPAKGQTENHATSVRVIRLGAAAADGGRSTGSAIKLKGRSNVRPARSRS
jgi:hypothetical protein